MTRFALAALLLATSSAIACSPPAAKNPDGSAWAIAPRTITDETFADAVVELIESPPEGDAGQALRLGVVQRQLAHAEHRFLRGDRAGATEATMAALYFLSAGDQQGGYLDDSSRHALQLAVESLSARGDFPRVTVLIDRLKDGASTEEIAKLDAELARIELFRQETLTGHPMIQAGDRERTAVKRALLDPEELPSADLRVSTLIDLAITANQEFQQTGRRPGAEVADEIIRGLDAGAFTIVSLRFRHRQFEPALEAVKETSAKLTLDPDFFAIMFGATTRDDAKSYRRLYDAYVASVGARAGGASGIDKDLYAAAQLSLLSEVVRRDPHDRETALDLSDLFFTLRVPEAVPAVLAKSSASASEVELIDMIGMVLGTVRETSEADDHPAVLRTLAAAKPIVKAASDRVTSGRGKRAIAELHRLEAKELLRAGRLAEASAALTAASESFADSQTKLRQAEVKKSLGDFAGALAELHVVASASDPLLTAEAHLLSAQIARFKGQDASPSLESAIRAAERAASEPGSTMRRVRALTFEGRARAASGDRAGAEKSFERALTEAAGDSVLTGQALLDALSTLWQLTDLDGMSKAFDLGAASAGAADLVYAALWMHHATLQKGGQVPAEVTSILTSASETPGWRGSLARFARGKITEAELVSLAASEVDRVEARFYAAMAKKTKGEDVRRELDDIAHAKSAELYEMRLSEAWTRAAGK